MELPPTTRRRDFLVNLALGLAVVPGFAVAAEYIRRFLVPATLSLREEILLTNLRDLPVGASRIFADVHGSDLVAVRLADREVRIFSSLCPHLGCRVGWDSAKNNFLCPCHEGRFDTSGRVVSGPPPEGLTKFTVRLDRDQVYVSVPLKEARG
jgi:cytochrome b6-f complex iron-sulfur subunit